MGNAGRRNEQGEVRYPEYVNSSEPVEKRRNLHSYLHSCKHSRNHSGVCFFSRYADSFACQERRGKKLGSAAMTADAKQTDFCVYLAGVLLAGPSQCGFGMGGGQTLLPL